MRFVGVALALGLTACASKTEREVAVMTKTPAVADAVAERHDYACADGAAFEVGYDEGYTFAEVTMGDRAWRLPAKMSASGSRYSDGKVEFWEHQGEAMLNGAPGGDHRSCTTGY